MLCVMPQFDIEEKREKNKIHLFLVCSCAIELIELNLHKNEREESDLTHSLLLSSLHSTNRTISATHLKCARESPNSSQPMPLYRRLFAGFIFVQFTCSSSLLRFHAKKIMKVLLLL